MSTKARWRHTYHCRSCGRVLAFVRPEMIVLRRLTIADDAKKTERVGSTVRVTCSCGAVLAIDWQTIQR